MRRLPNPPSKSPSVCGPRAARPFRRRPPLLRKQPQRLPLSRQPKRTALLRHLQRRLLEQTKPPLPKHPRRPCAVVVLPPRSRRQRPSRKPPQLKLHLLQRKLRRPPLRLRQFPKPRQLLKRRQLPRRAPAAVRPRLPSSHPKGRPLTARQPMCRPPRPQLMTQLPPQLLRRLRRLREPQPLKQHRPELWSSRKRKPQKRMLRPA